MSNLLVILKNSFINNTGINSLANGINGGKEKKKLLFSTFMLIFIGALICFMSTTYSLMMAEALQEIGYLDLLLVMAILVSCMLGLFTSIYKAQGVLFNAKDYDLLIKESEEKIEKLTQNLKSEKVNLKSLKKSKELYEIQKEEEKKAEMMNKIAQLIAESGKSLEEIEEYFSSTSDKEE